jgi:hypothetical protein
MYLGGFKHYIRATRLAHNKEICDKQSALLDKISVKSQATFLQSSAKLTPQRKAPLVLILDFLSALPSPHLPDIMSGASSNLRKRQEAADGSWKSWLQVIQVNNDFIFFETDDFILVRCRKVSKQSVLLKRNGESKNLGFLPRDQRSLK